MENNQNPLTQYFRDVAIYIQLPSNGFYSNPGDIETSTTGEIAVYPMTTSDELLFKSPDALLNGESVANVIQSCAPGIKNIRNLPVNDVEVLLLAIKHASFGDQVDFEIQCPECENTQAFGVSIEACLANIETLQPDAKAVLKNNLTVKIKPYTYDSSVKAAMLAFNEGKFLQMLMQEDLSDEDKASKASESLKRATQLTTDLLTDSIVAIYNPEGELITDNSEFIKQWLLNTTRKDAKQIEDEVIKLNETGINKNFDLTCDKCEHKWTTKIEFDPSSFFE